MSQPLLGYEARANHAWERMLQLVGVYTARVLVQRALWDCSQRYVEAGAIRLTDQGIDLQGLFHTPDAARRQEVADFFLASLTGLLARLVGPEVAATLALEIPTARAVD